jgi:hypothetical protein
MKEHPMKKLVRVSVICLLLPLAGLAAEEEAWDSLYAPWDLTVSAATGVMVIRNNPSLAVFPAAELIVHEFVVSHVVPLKVGAAARGLVNLFFANDSWGDYGWLAFGGGAFGTVHFTFRGSNLNIPAFFEKLDIYTALGLVFTYIEATGDWGSLNKYADTGLGFAAYGGFSYFLNSKLALYLEGSYWDYGGGAAVGMLLKF